MENLWVLVSKGIESLNNCVPKTNSLTVFLIYKCFQNWVVGIVKAQ